MCEGGDMYTCIMVEWVQLTWVQIWKMNGARCVGNDASVAVIYYVCCIEGMQGLEHVLPIARRFILTLCGKSGVAGMSGCLRIFRH